MIERPASGNSFWVMHCIYYEPVSVQKNCSLKLQESEEGVVARHWEDVGFL